MSKNYGKDFERIFKRDFLNTLEKSTIDRINDTMSGFKKISNVSDFIGYKKPNIYYIECKSKKGNTFPLKNLTQYDKLLAKKGIEGARVGVVLWFIDHKRVTFIPISSFEKLKEDNKKSFNVKMIDTQEYYNLEIPSITQRIFPICDYSALKDLTDENGQ